MSGTRGLVATRRTEISGEYLDGTVRTSQGIVEVLTSPKDGYSRLDFIWKGRHWIRVFEGKKSLTARGLARAASRFAHQVTTTVKR